MRCVSKGTHLIFLHRLLCVRTSGDFIKQHSALFYSREMSERNRSARTVTECCSFLIQCEKLGLYQKRRNTMSKLRKKLIAVLAVLFCALPLLSTTLIYLPNKKANAERIATDFTVIGASNNDLWVGSENRFNRKLLVKLYETLTNTSGATLDTVTKNLVDPYVTSLNINSDGLVSSTNIRAQSTGNKNISIWFGGFKWDVVSMTKTRTQYSDSTTNVNGDNIVLTLWQSADNVSYNQNDLSSFSAHSVSTDDGDVDYPDCMYGTSYIRAVKLNAGGTYSTSTKSTTSPPQSASNKYARFTMSGASNSLVKYIVKPIDIAYQEFESAVSNRNAAIGEDFQFPNCAYGQTTGFYIGQSDNNISKVQEKAGYDNWKNDYIWLPSIAETGNDNGTNQNGIWKTDSSLRSAGSANTWLRSGGIYYPANANILLPTGLSTGATTITSNLAVRPAFHLNLTVVDENSKKVLYDDDAGKDGKTYEHEYDGKNFEVDILDSDMLILDTNILDNPTAPADYTGGKFSATEPKAKDEMIYSLVIKPDKNKGFYWADWESRSGSDDDKRYGARTYKIKITLAKITTNANWKAPSCSVGGSLLQGSGGLTLQGGKTPTTVYHMEYDATKYPAAGNAESWADSEWSNDATKFKADKAGYYRVYYKVSADFHETAIFSYVVSVGADNIHISVKSGSSIPDTTYSNDKDTDFLKWLKGELAQVVDIKGSTITYDPATYLSDKDLILRDSDGNEVSAQSNKYYPAGTYTVDFKDSPTWDTDLPTVTINKKEIVVKVVADSTDGLTHAYGDSHAKMKVVLNDNSTTLPDGDDITTLGLNKFILKKDNGDTVVLDETTPVCKGVVEADTSKITNYKIKFETNGSDYEVTKKKVELQVTDEEAPYGTDFTNYKYKSLKFKDGEKLANNELLSEVVTSTTYSLKKNGVDTNFSTTLPIGEYELYAKAEADNYEFTVDFGKLKITQAEFDMKDVTFTNASYVHDGNPHAAKISGTLPSNEITVSYRYVNIADGSESTDPPAEIGVYLVYASFTHSNGNYKDINDKVAYLRIVASADELNQDYPPLPSDEDIANAAELAKKKQEAKKKLYEEAQAKKNAIDANKDMTAEDKKAAKEEIEKELKEGNAAIDSAKDASGVEQAFNDGKSEMEDTVELAETKTDAKKELGEEAQAKKDAIDSDKNLTDEEKAAAKAEIDKELEKGKKEIDKAKNADDVESAHDTSEKKIEDYTELVQKKGKAKSELDKAAKDKNDAIDASEMTDEEKAEAKKKVEEELADGKANIDDATDKSGIDAAESTAASKIKSISTETKSYGSFPWWIIAVGAGALALLAVIIIVVLKRRNSEDDEEDYYDDEYDYADEEEYEDEGEDYGDEF